MNHPQQVIQDSESVTWLMPFYGEGSERYEHDVCGVAIPLIKKTDMEPET